MTWQVEMQRIFLEGNIELTEIFRWSEVNNLDKQT